MELDDFLHRLSLRNSQAQVNSLVIILDSSESATSIYITVTPAIYPVNMVGASFEDLMATYGDRILAIRVLQGIHTYEILQQDNPLLIGDTKSHLGNLW